LEAEEKGKARHSKPGQARAPYEFFKEEHSEWDESRIKEEWKNKPDAEKEPYKEKSKQEREKRKIELEEYKKVQDAIKVQKNSAGQGRQVLGKKK